MLKLCNSSTVLQEEIQIPHLGILLGILREGVWLSLQPIYPLLWSKYTRLSEVLLKCCSLSTPLLLSWQVPLFNPTRKLSSVLNIQHKCHFPCAPNNLRQKRLLPYLNPQYKPHNFLFQHISQCIYNSELCQGRGQIPFTLNKPPGTKQVRNTSLLSE